MFGSRPQCHQVTINKSLGDATNKLTSETAAQWLLFFYFCSLYSLTISSHFSEGIVIVNLSASIRKPSHTNLVVGGEHVLGDRAKPNNSN